MSTAAARVFRGCRALMSSSAAAAGGKRDVSAAGAGAAVAKPKATKASAKPKAAKAAAKPKADGAAPKPNSGILRLVPVSDALRRFPGGAPLISRAGAVKMVWDHIKLNDLQNPLNKREIFCDEKLKSIFAGKDKVGMLEIAKLLSPHFVKSN